MKNRVQFIGGKMVKEHVVTRDGEVCDARYLEDIKYREVMEKRVSRLETILENAGFDLCHETIN
jgi:tetrahydromethanopterin S-methyltransferase subunit F